MECRRHRARDPTLLQNTMVNVTSSPVTSVTTPHHSKLTWAIADTFAVAARNVIGMLRTAEVLAFATVMP
jgi:hypothetical protein